MSSLVELHGLGTKGIKKSWPRELPLNMVRPTGSNSHWCKPMLVSLVFSPLLTGPTSFQSNTRFERGLLNRPHTSYTNHTNASRGHMACQNPNRSSSKLTRTEEGSRVEWMPCSYACVWWETNTKLTDHVTAWRVFVVILTNYVVGGLNHPHMKVFPFTCRASNGDVLWIPPIFHAPWVVEWVSGCVG